MIASIINLVGPPVFLVLFFLLLVGVGTLES